MTVTAIKHLLVLLFLVVLGPVGKGQEKSLEQREQQILSNKNLPEVKACIGQGQFSTSRTRQDMPAPLLQLLNSRETAGEGEEQKVGFLADRTENRLP